MSEPAWLCWAGRTVGWFWLTAPDGPFEQLDLRAVANRIGSDAEAATLPRPQAIPRSLLGALWVGRVEGSHVRVATTDGEFRLSVADLAHIESSGTVGRSSESLPSTPRIPLRNRRLGQRLLRRGWVKIPLLSTPEVETLRTAYGELHGWSGEGFDPDPGNPDFEYRARTSDVLAQHLDRRLSVLFDRFEPFIRGFYCKWPRAEATALHWDWSCVDQRLGHRSYQVWIALDDIATSNGQMALLTGSHDVYTTPRGSGLAMPVTPTVEERLDQAIGRCTRVSLRRGEALVFDQGLLHITFPNQTDRPRLACAAALRPAEAGLAHFQQLVEGVAVRYEVDDWWFGHMCPDRLGLLGPSFRPAETLRVRPEPAEDERMIELLSSPGGGWIRRRSHRR